jgi:hypothetical protein
MKKIGAIEICEGLTVKEVVATAGGGMFIAIMFYVGMVGAFVY